MCKRKTVIIYLILLICFMNQPAVSEEKEVAFKGRVVDTDGRPIAGAKVKLYDTDYGREIYTFVKADVIETASDPNGEFSFSHKTENYPYGYIVAEKEGLALDCVCWEMREDKEFEFRLGPAKKLAGTVVDENGEPVSQANVSILMLKIGKGEERNLSMNIAQAVLSTNTDRDGKFSFTNLPAEATVEFLVQKQDRASVSTFDQEMYLGGKLQFSPGQEDIRIIQPPESKIEGVVVEKGTGNPVAGVKLLIRRGRNYHVYGQDVITSGEDGTFSISKLYANSFKIIFAAPRNELADWIAEPVNVTINVGQSVKGLRLELIKGGLLEIHVTGADTNKPIEGANVSVHNDRLGLWFNGKSDDKGMGRIRVLPGEYTSVNAYMRGYSNFFREEAITIEEGSTKRLEWRLSPQPTLTGIAFDESSNPVEGVEITILPGAREQITSDSEGKFEIIWDNSGWGEDTVFCLVARYEQRNLAAAVEIGKGVRKLDLKLQPGVNLTGKVVDPNGKGIAGARIRPMLRLSSWGSPITRSETEETDKNGDFEIKAVPAGHNYNIDVIAEGYGEQNVDVQTDNAVNNKMDIEAIILPPANLSISGQVVDTQGNPVPNARIATSGDNQSRVEARADDRGDFTVNGVCPGQVYVRVDAEQGGKRLSARVHTDGGAKDIKIIVREGRPAHYYIHTKTYEQIIRDAEKIIAGVAVDENGSPVANVPVGVRCIKRKRDDGRFSWTYSSYHELSSITDEQGRFAIELKEDAEYVLLFSPVNQAALLVYDIPAGKKDMKVVLPKGGTIKGQLVRMEKGKKVPIANVEVKLEQEYRASYTHLGFDRDRTAITDSQGRFIFEHVRTKIRPMDSRDAEHWEHVPRVWQISYGDISKSVAFYDGTTIDDFNIVVNSAGQQISMGGTLPGFDEVKINLDDTQTQEKRMLVCFFDMNQRPSRNCVMQLNKRVDELKEQGLVVVAIQASKVDESALSDWVKKQNISLPCGMIEGEEDKTRLKWGVKSLPWLILTDKNHAVIAEGFSIIELDEKLGK